MCWFLLLSSSCIYRGPSVLSPWFNNLSPRRHDSTFASILSILWNSIRSFCHFGMLSAMFAWHRCLPMFFWLFSVSIQASRPKFMTNSDGLWKFTQPSAESGGISTRQMHNAECVAAHNQSRYSVFQCVAFGLLHLDLNILDKFSLFSCKGELSSHACVRCCSMSICLCRWCSRGARSTKSALTATQLSSDETTIVFHQGEFSSWWCQ
jgi:hypothetical protein